MDCPAADLSPLTSLKKLKTLSILRQDGYTADDAYDLAPLTNCARLQTLTLSGLCTQDLEPLQNLQTLAALSVSGLGEADYTPITALRLTHLALSGAPADQVATIFTAVGKRLTSAVVGGCTLTGEANAALLSCSRLASLRLEAVEGLDTGAGRVGRAFQADHAEHGRLYAGYAGFSVQLCIHRHR